MTIFILAVPAFLCGTMIGGFALVVMGIHRGDRPNRFAHRPSTRTEAVALHVLGVGIRVAEHPDDEEGGL